MKIKAVINNIFSYKERNTDDFLIPSSPNNIQSLKNSDKKISTNYDENLEYLKVKYNLLINSDITTREFEIKISNKKFKACLIFVDGMVDTESLNNSILKPLLLKNSIKMQAPLEKPKLNQSKKFDLQEFLLKNLITQNTIQIENDFKTVFEKINSGFSALFVDTLASAFCIEARDLQGRNVAEPQTESVVRGPHAAFIENIRTNTSLIRKIVNNENLVIESLNVGKITKTQVAVCYIKNITNEDLISEVKFRINNLKIDNLTSSGELENLIKDDLHNLYPELIATERPDKTSSMLLGGRVAILVNGSPYALIVPAVFIDFFTSGEDVNLNHFYSNFLKLIRIIAFSITLLLPGLYIAFTIYHDEFLPSELLFAIISSKEKIPFPIIFEVIIMEVSFELIREAGVRVPAAFGQTIGIVGALILGEAAVSANIVSPILIIIISITAISEFVLPDFSFSFSIRIFRIIYIILGYLAGLFGIACGIFVHLIYLTSSTSFGVPFLSYTSFSNYPVKPIWKNETRGRMLNTKRPRQEEEISMPWRNLEK
jgi:spore germination protein KA